MRKLKFWFILQSLILGLQIALKPCNQRKRQRYYVQYFYRRGSGERPWTWAANLYRRRSIPFTTPHPQLTHLRWQGAPTLGGPDCQEVLPSFEPKPVFFSTLPSFLLMHVTPTVDEKRTEGSRVWPLTSLWGGGRTEWGRPSPCEPQLIERDSGWTRAL